MTAFFLPETRSTDIPAWADLTGEEPEQTTRNGSLVRSEGRFASGRLGLATVAPGRADLVYGAVAPEITALEDFAVPNVGAPRAAIEELNPAIGRFLRNRRDIVRLAVGAHLSWPTSSRDESYSRVVQVIRTVAFNLTAASDFIYQVNRPRRAQTLDGLELNRLAKWSSIKNVIMLTDPNTTALSRSTERHSVLLEIDMSTDANRSNALPEDRLLGLVQELFILGEEIAANGDVP